MITEAALAMNFGASAENIVRSCPTTGGRPITGMIEEAGHQYRYSLEFLSRDGNEGA